MIVISISISYTHIDWSILYFNFSFQLSIMLFDWLNVISIHTTVEWQFVDIGSLFSDFNQYHKVKQAKQSIAVW